MHIDLDYYKTTFHGRDPGDDDELERLIDRASDIIDILISPREFDGLEGAQLSDAKRAVAYQTEFLVENGDVFSEAAGGSEKVGSWSQSGGGDGPAVISPMVKAVLSKRGLMYSGAEVLYEADQL